MTLQEQVAIEDDLIQDNLTQDPHNRNMAHKEPTRLVCMSWYRLNEHNY